MQGDMQTPLYGMRTLALLHRRQTSSGLGGQAQRMLKLATASMCVKSRNRTTADMSSRRQYITGRMYSLLHQRSHLGIGHMRRTFICCSSQGTKLQNTHVSLTDEF